MNRDEYDHNFGLEAGANGYDDGVLQEEWNFEKNTETIDNNERLEVSGLGPRNVEEEKLEVPEGKPEVLEEKIIVKEENQEMELENININEEIESYEDLKSKIEEYIQNRTLMINSLKIKIERLTEERDSFAKDGETDYEYSTSSKKDVIDDYNKRIEEAQKELKELLDPSQVTLSHINNEITAYQLNITNNIKKVNEKIESIQAKNVDLKYIIDTWYTKNRGDDSELNKIRNEYNKNIDYINSLKLYIQKYEELRESLRNYYSEVINGYMKRVNDIYNKKDNEVKTPEVPIEEPTKDPKEPKTEPIEEPIEDPTEPKTEPDEEPTEEPTEPEEEFSLEEFISKLIGTLDPELPENELKIFLDQIQQVFMEIVERDTKEFIEDLKNSSNFRDKINAVTKFENKIAKYSDLLKHENPAIQAILDEQGLVEKFKEVYKENKANSSEYCWREYDSVSAAIEYVDTNVNTMLLNQYLEDMLEVVKNPTEENHNKWRQNMIDFTTIEGYDANMLSTYLTAYIKDHNRNLSVDNEFNIVGLNLQKTMNPTPEPVPEPTPEPKKKKRKVTGVKKVLNWMKEHKLATLGIGLAIAGVTLLAIPQTHMMINSGLWHALKALGVGSGTLNKLNATNLALSKVAQGGKFAFNAGSGLYTLSGAAGAKAMYTAGSAKLLTALEGVLLGGGIAGVGTAVVSAVKAIKNKIQQKREEKLNKKDNEIINNGYVEDFIIKEDYSDLEPTDYTDEAEEVHSKGM